MTRRISATLGLLLGVGCGPALTHVATDAPLGRVVSYRSGVAFYERRAMLDDGRLSVKVPRDRVDDFLKSLTIVDVASGERLSVTIPRQQAASGDYLLMDLQTPTRQRAEVVLTYVTEAAAWNPSYRVAVTDDGTVRLEGWAIVDNTSGEDWRGVLVGVGASSALSFRYDLWSVRTVDRALLAETQTMALAPPTGVSPFGGADLAAPAGGEIVAWFDGGGRGYDVNIPVPGRTFEAVLGAAAGSQEDGLGVTFSGSSGLENQYYVDGVATTSAEFSTTSVDLEELAKLPGRDSPLVHGSTGRRTSDPKDPPAPPAPPPPHYQDYRQFNALVPRVRDTSGTLVIQADVAGAPVSVALDARARAHRVRNQLIDAGLAPARGQFAETPARGGGSVDVRVVLVAAPPSSESGAAGPATTPAGSGVDPDAAPVGESHFLAERPMDVPSQASAMVSMLQADTEGGVVYLYDPISARGDARDAFRAIRFVNPTGDTLEPGPMTVYGDGRFVGEGLAEAIPPHATTVVPFAQDRQVVIDRAITFADELVGITGLERGVFTAKLARRRTTTLTLHSRLAVATTVYVRHGLDDGWSIDVVPEGATRLASSRVFPVALPAGGRATLALAETTPIEQTLRLDAAAATPLLTDYAARPGTAPALAAALREVLAARGRIQALGLRLVTLREQLDSYREREVELTLQLTLLARVKAAGELARLLRSKLAELATLTQTTTIALVDGQGQLLVERTRLQTQLAERRLP